MKTLGRNADNDLYLEAGELAILHDADAQCAIIESILLTQKGELPFDEDAGIDYFGTVLQNPTYIDFWAAQVQSKIRDLDFVTSIEDFTYRFDRSSSTLFWSMTVVNTDNERLDLKNKKTIIDGSPGIDVSWDDIYDKPKNIQESLSLIDNMHAEAVDINEKLTSSSTLRDTKALLNNILFAPVDSSYAKTKLITFSFDGVPLGTVIDFSNLSLDVADTSTTDTPYYAPITVELSDGTKVTLSEVTASGNKVIFEDTHTSRHTIMVGGALTVSIKGNIKAIRSDDEERPIFLTSTGEPFLYLTKIGIGKRVPIVALGKKAFVGFSNLREINWTAQHENPISLGVETFSECKSLLDLKWMPSNLSTIGEACFRGCLGLSSVDGLDNTAISVLPDYCFAGCSSLTDICHLPSAITDFGKYVFQGCTSLKSIDGLPNGITSFGEGCFQNCTGISAILYPPESLTLIGDSCFENNISLTSLFLPKAISSIGENAFAGCVALTDIRSDAEGSVAITESTFSGATTGLTVYVPQDRLAYYEGDANWQNFNPTKYGVFEFSLADLPSTQFSLYSGSSYLQSSSIWTIEYYEGDKEKRFTPSTSGLPTYTYPLGQHEAKVTIKGYIKQIAAASETEYPFLSSVPSTSGGNRDFPYLKKIEVHNSPIEKIGDYAFALCTELNSVDFGLGEGYRPYCLGARTFWGCTSLDSTAWLVSGLGELVSPDDGTPYSAFGEGCFYQSGIVALNYATEAVSSLPAYCFAETPLVLLNGIAPQEGNSNLSSLGEHCFDGCYNLQYIEALSGTSITAIPEYCFANCRSLRSIGGIQNIATLGEHSFENCTSLSSIAPLEGAAAITALPAYLFAGCSAISTLEGITGKITSLGEHCFDGCTMLSDLFALNSATAITELSAYCFANCSSLKTLIGCYNIQTIGTGAFASCTGLLSTSGLGPNITTIEEEAFSYCSALQYVTFLASAAPQSAQSAFEGVGLGGLRLYVREEAISSFNTGIWVNFATRESRSIAIVLTDFPSNTSGITDGAYEISHSDAQTTLIRSWVGTATDVPGVWHVDYGDGTEIQTVYGNGSLLRHGYSTTGSTITIFGDVSELWSKPVDSAQPIEYDKAIHGNPSDVASLISNGQISPFLGTLADSVSSVRIVSSYLQKIGDFCFMNYGRSGAISGNVNSLSVTINLAESGTVGAYAFAKDDLHANNGPIGSILSYTPTSIGDFGFYQAGLTSSDAFWQLVSGGEYAFANNGKLLDVTGFAKLTAVSSHMFANCGSLISTKGLTSVTEIGVGGFSGCTSLATITDFGTGLSTIASEAFRGCPVTKLFMAMETPPSLVRDAFDGTYDSYEDAMLDGPYSTAVLYVPAGAEQTYLEAENWKYFKNVRVRAVILTLKSVPAGATIPAGMGKVTANGKWFLSFGENEDTFQFGTDATTDLPSYRFKTSGDKTIKLSGPITAVACSSDAYPLFGQSKGSNPWLTSISATDDIELTSIGEYTFAGCKSLQRVIHLPSVLSLGENAFWGDSSLTEISGLYGVSSIAERAFYQCSSLKGIDGLGMNVSSIGASAFVGCPLSEVQVFSTEPPTMEATAFDGIDGSKVPLYVRTKSLAKYKADSSWSSKFSIIRSRTIEFTLTGLQANTVVRGDKGVIDSDTFWVADWDADNADGRPYKQIDENNTISDNLLPKHVYGPGNHVLRLEGAIKGISGLDGSFLSLEKDDSETVQYLTRVERMQYSPLVVIGPNTFYQNTNLSVAALVGVTSIGESSFEETALTSTAFLTNVTSIGDRAFYGCTGLLSITGLEGYTEGADPQIEIGAFAFGGIPEIKYIQVGIPDVSNARIQDTSFGDYTEDRASQKEITVYVPMESVAAYSNEWLGSGEDNPWHYFTIASQVLTFILENVPSGTTILGTAERVVSDSRWSIDWDDGSTDSMDSTTTAFPAHAYVYNEDAEDTGLWERIGNVMCRKQIRILLSGAFKSLSCKSEEQCSFLAVANGEGNPYLKSISAPSSLATLTELGQYVFRGCNRLESITGFSYVTSIGQYAFYGCSALSDIGGKENGFTSVRAIGERAFAGCSNLTSLSSFASLLNIGLGGFENCISLTGTTGMGSAYGKWGIQEAYEQEYSIGTDVSTCPWYIAGEYSGEEKTVQTIKVSPPDADSGSLVPITLKENGEGWYGLSSITITAEGTVKSLNWQQKTFSSFGALAFSGCGFGAIDMDNYAYPPTIQSSTFPGDPSSTLVFVSSKKGSAEKYRTAPIWLLYFNNIIAASSFSISLADGTIPVPVTTTTDQGVGYRMVTKGKAIYGKNGRVDFKGNYLIIDWGDGTTTTKIANSDEGYVGWTFPNHAYASGVTGGPVTITIRGDISKIYLASGDEQFTDDDTPADNVNPFFCLTTFNTVVDTSAETTTPITTIEEDPAEFDYGFKFSLDFGAGTTLSRIGAYCFQGCNIAEINIGQPEMPLTIGDCAFRNCGIKGENQSGMSILASPGSIGTVGYYAFANCTQLTSTDFIRGATIINSSAFRGDIGLLNTDGLDAVHLIGECAFMGCTGLTRITLPSTLTALGASAFEGCANVSEGITWDASTEDIPDLSIGEYAFYGCGNNCTVEIPWQVHAIGEEAFTKSGISSFIWGIKPDGVEDSPRTYKLAETTDDGVGIFEQCSLLGTVKFLVAIEKFPKRTFCNCTSLSSIEGAGEEAILLGLKTIDAYAFMGCANLSNDSFAHLIANVSGSVGPYAFAQCTTLSEISIPATVTTLGEGCFSRSARYFLTGQYRHSTVQESTEQEESEIEDGGTEGIEFPSFYGIQTFEEWMTKQYGKVRTDVWDIYDNILQQELPSTEANTFSVSWANDETKEQMMGAGCFMNCIGLDIDWATFPNVKQIPAYCFYNCQSLFRNQNLSVLPSSIVALGRFAFARTGLVGIGRRMPNGEEAAPITASLAPALFLKCPNLTSLGYAGDGGEDKGDGLSNLFSMTPSAIPDACFYGCSLLSDINALAECEVKQVGNYSFAKTGVNGGSDQYNITDAMATVIAIGDGCFMDCPHISGVFYGLPLVTYYPYKCFYGTQIGTIQYLYIPNYGIEEGGSIANDDVADVLVSLEGDSFGGNPNITSISLPYSRMVAVVTANGSSDPFSGIDGQAKENTSVIVPNEVVSQYNADDYWNKFSILTSFDGLTSAIAFGMTIPSGGGTLYGSGQIKIDTEQAESLKIAWGDGTGDDYSTSLVAGVLDLSIIHHTYANTEGRPISRTLSIYGAIKSIEGIADNVTSSIIANKTVVPCFYTNVIATQPGNNKPRLAENTWFTSAFFDPSSTSLETIGDGCFGYCSNMTIPRIPLSVKTLGRNAFFGCSGLTSLDIIQEGTAIQEIGQYCFAYCENLIDYQGFKNLTTLEVVPAGCFAKERSTAPEGEVKLDWLPASIKSIGFAAFQHVCFSYFDVDTTNAITVGNYAFRYNTSLVNFTKGDGSSNPGIKLNLTGTNVFRDCTALSSLTGLTLAATNTSIPIGTFRGCSSLTDISSLQNITSLISLGDASFYGTAITTLAGLPSTLTTIGTYPFPTYDNTFIKDLGGVFENCARLTSLTGMPSVSSIGTAAFKGCSLGSLSGISSFLTQMGDYCFANCASMEDAEDFPSSLSVLPEGCFIGCIGLTTITLPNTISEIRKKCFANSAALTLITINGTDVITLDDNPANTTVDNCFPYAALNANNEFYVYVVASSALDAYKAHWGVNNRFSSSKIVDVNPT